MGGIMDKVFTAHLLPLIEIYKNDPESVYNTWFVGSAERLKAFRSIRRGVETVVQDIQGGRFPNDFKGSSIEFVLTCITEQKQVFEGAAHPFSTWGWASYPAWMRGTARRCPSHRTSSRPCGTSVMKRWGGTC